MLQVKHFECEIDKSYYNEFIVWSQVISYSRMVKILNQFSTKKHSTKCSWHSYVVIDWKRISMRRVRIIMDLFKEIKFDFLIKDCQQARDWVRFVIINWTHVYDFPEFMDKTRPIKREDILIKSLPYVKI